METVQTDLVITGAHTEQPSVCWTRQPEYPVLSEMAANGIKIVRA